MMTAWIGLTGGIGSGKSQVAACFSALNVPVIDADAIARELTTTPNSAALQQIAVVFGRDMLDDVGALNRVAMRERVFADETARQQLEAILHPLILAQIVRLQGQYADAIYGVVEIPTLVEHDIFQSVVQKVLVVMCDENVRVARVMRRSHLTEDAVRAIMRAQASDVERIALADDLICNEGSLNDLNAAVLALHSKYCGQFNR